MTTTAVTPSPPSAANQHGGFEGFAAWRDFAPGKWQESIDVRDFIIANFDPYIGDSSFLSGPTSRTTAVWNQLLEMFPKERAQGVYDIDAKTPRSILPGF